MSLTSTSTISDALAQYNDNLSWDDDSAKAALALEAIRYLLINRAQGLGTEGRNINYASLETEKARLEKYLNTSNQAAGTNRTSFTRATVRQ